MNRESIGIRALIIGLLSLVAMICFFPGTSRADNITVTVDGTEYFVSTVTGTFTDNMTQLESTPWWGDQSLAQALAGAVADDIGTPNNGGDGGPLFAYSLDAVNAYLFVMGNVNQVSVSPAEVISFAFGNVVATPEPGSLSMLFAGLLGFGLFAGMKHLRRNALATEA